MENRIRRDERSRSYSRSRSRSRSRTRTRTRSRSRSCSRSRSPSPYRRRGRGRSSRSTSRSRSGSNEPYGRSRSRDRYSRSPRLDDELGDVRDYHRGRRTIDTAPPNSTLVVKGLPPDWDEPVMWELLSQQGFHPKDIRILKRRDTGQGRGFGFVEFLDVDEATRWMEYTQGRLKLDDRYWADIYYSRAPHSTSAANMGPASALAVVLAQRGGDWICAKCGTNNFKKRDLCFKCNLKREESEALVADGYTEIGVLPCDTLLLRNLPATADEDKILSALKNLTDLDIVRVMIARNPSTEATRSYAYVQLATSAEATQLLTSLTALTSLVIDGQEMSVSYSKLPLTVALTGTTLTQTSGNVSWPTASAVASQFNGMGGLTQTDVTNAAAAVAQSAIKKAHVMRHVAAQHVQQAAQLASFRAATMFVPTSAILLQHHQQILAAQALQEMATVQLLQEQVNRQSATLTDLGTVQTPHGELPRYPVPEVHKFQLDPTTGYYFDPTTGLHYDPNSQYFYNSETRQYLHWDATYQTYLPAPSEADNSTTQQEIQQSSGNDKDVDSTAPTGSTNATADKSKGEKKEVKEKKDKANIAKKIQKDMEKWAKQLNQRKEAQKTVPIFSSTSVVSGETTLASTSATAGNDEKTGSADAAFSILERTRGASGFKGSLVSYDAGGDSDDEQGRILAVSHKREDDADFADWTKMACLLCRRQFPNKETLIKHQQFSDLHKQNLLARTQQRESSDYGSLDQPSGGIRYRDRAKERRQKFGTDDEKEPSRIKQKYYGVGTGTSAERARTAELTSSEPSGASSQDSIGSKLLKSMGWQEGQGLGRSNQGIVDPIMSQRRIQGAGLGASGAVLTTSASASYKEHVKAALRQKFFQDMA